QLLAFRRKSNADDYLSVYVVAVGWTDSRYAKFSISVVGEANNTFKKDTDGHVLHFTKEETDWGFDEYIRFNELTDPSNGYMFNDACTVEVELCSFSKQDFIEELEPMELIEIESDHSDLEFTHEKTKKRKELEEDNSSSVQRKRPAIERDKQREGEKATENGEEAIQDGEQVIESGEEAIQGGEQVIESGEEAIQDGEQVAESGNEAIQDGEQVIESGEEAIQDGEQVIESSKKAVQHGKNVVKQWLRKGLRFSTKKRAAAGGEKAAGSGQLLNGKEVAVIGEENERIIEESTSSGNIEPAKQPAKNAKRTLKKKFLKAIVSVNEAIQDGDQVIESGEEASQHGKRVTQKWQGQVQRFSRKKRATAKGSKAAGSG
ncbi:hypothetical protein MKW92_013751, partial [Papaver armeniacum]